MAKKGKKKLLLVVLPVILLGGGFVGLAVAGLIKVPGLTPKKPQTKPMYGEVAKKAEAPPKPAPKKPEKKDEPPVVKSDPPIVDPEAGALKVAQLWNGVPTAQLLGIAKSYKDQELAKILVKMDPEKVAELLGTLDAKRSATVSKELQRVASFLPAKKGS